MLQKKLPWHQDLGCKQITETLELSALSRAVRSCAFKDCVTHLMRDSKSTTSGTQKPRTYDRKASSISAQFTGKRHIGLSKSSDIKASCKRFEIGRGGPYAFEEFAYDLFGGFLDGFCVIGQLQ